VPFRVLLAAAVLVLCSAAAASHDPTEVRRVAGAVSKDLGVQSRLPNSSGTEAPEKRTSGDRGFGGEGISIPAPAAVFTLLQWVAIAVAAVVLLAVLASILRERLDSGVRRAASGVREEAEVPLPATDPRALLARADELAAAGHYAEAMHCVLLAAMATIGGGQPQESTDSLTSWELLRAVALSPMQRQALRDLVIRVERAWFGKSPAAVDDYRFVRGRFDAFSAAAGESA